MNDIQLTPRANQLISEAKAIAVHYKRDYVGTEHILLAALSPNGEANESLRGFFSEAGFDPVELAARIERVIVAMYTYP